MDIQKARPEDAPFVRAIAEAAYRPYVRRIGRKPAPMTADFAGLIAAGEVWCLTDIAEIVGYIVLRTRGDSLHVENVAVAPERHGCGFGRALMQHAEAEARRRGLAGMDLYTNALMRENIALYTQLGWTLIGKRREAGFERVFFNKPVAM